MNLRRFLAGGLLDHWKLFGLALLLAVVGVQSVDQAVARRNSVHVSRIRRSAAARLPELDLALRSLERSLKRR